MPQTAFRPFSVGFKGAEPLIDGGIDMSQTVFKPDGLTDTAEESPWWFYYIKAVDAICDTTHDEWEIHADRAGRSVDELKRHRGKLLQLTDRLNGMVTLHRLKRITVEQDDLVGQLVHEIDNFSKNILTVFASQAPSLEQLDKALPSSKFISLTEKKLTTLEGVLDCMESNLSSIFVELPQKFAKFAQELRRINRFDGANYVLQFKESSDTIHRKLLTPQESPGNISFSDAQILVNGKTFVDLKNSFLAAEKEWKQIMEEEGSINFQRKRQEQALAHEIDSLSNTVRYDFLILWAALAALIALLVQFRGWAAFGVSIITLGLSIVAGLCGIFFARIKPTERKEFGGDFDLPEKLDFDDETLGIFAFGLPLAFGVFQLVGAAFAAILIKFNGQQLNSFFEAVLPVGSWSRFFGFIVTGSLACLTALTVTMAASKTSNYCSLVNRRRHAKRQLRLLASERVAAETKARLSVDHQGGIEYDDEPQDGSLYSGSVGSIFELKLSSQVRQSFCFIPPGSFLMGSPARENGHRDSENQVEVTLSQPFWLAKTEVTQAQWEAVMGNNPSSFKGPNLPVESVSWEDTQAFIGMLNLKQILPDGWKFALPTEAQWEYACRAGERGPYSGGSLEEVGWYEGNSGGGTHEVGQKKPNAWGLHDMHGNVYESCADWHDGTLKGRTDPTGPSSGVNRMYRGGAWSLDASFCRAADRFWLFPGRRLNFLGFRPALVLSR